MFAFIRETKQPRKIVRREMPSPKVSPSTDWTCTIQKRGRKSAFLDQTEGEVSMTRSGKGARGKYGPE